MKRILIVGGLFALAMAVLAVLVVTNLGALLLDQVAGGDATTIEPAPDTTFVTEPLTPSGRIDFVAALNARMQVAKPDENVLCGLLPIMKVSYYPPEFYRLLRAPSLDRDAERLRTVYQFLDDRKENFEETLSGADFALFDYCTQHPWDAESHPLVAEYFQANVRFAERVREAARRPKFHFPMLPPEGETLDSVSLEAIQACRDAGRLLLLRAMHRFPAGGLGDARDDVDAAHMLAERVASECHSWIHASIAVGLESAACETDRAIAAHPAWKPEELRGRAKRFLAVAPLIDVQRTFGVGERLVTLAAAVKLMTTVDDDSPRPNDFNGKRLKKLAERPYDRNEALRRINRAFDDVCKELKNPGRVARERRLQEIENSLMREHVNSDFDVVTVNSIPRVAMHPKGFRAGRGEKLGALLVQLNGLTRYAGRLIDSPLTQRRLTALCYLAVAWKKEHGTYPKALAELADPKTPSLLIDPFSEKPFDWLIVDGRARISSAGPDGKIDREVPKVDEFGVALTADAARAASDDVVVELP